MGESGRSAFGSSIQLGLQGGLCFGLSLILGGLFFAATMRRHGFTTLIDPFEARFGIVCVSGYGSSENAIILLPAPRAANGAPPTHAPPRR